MGFRFLHAADLHLDSPFTGLAAAAPVEVAEMLRDATFGSWRRIVDLAIEQRVDFVLVAGDVFESANRTLLAQVRFRDGLVQLSDARIPSFVVTGNHDPLSGWEPSVAWPPLAYRFPAHEVTSVPVRRGGGEAEPELARIHGISFHVRDVTENLALRFRRDPGAPFSIGLLHANVGSNPAHAPYSPGSIDDLRAAGLDYWALGHIHKPAILSEGNPAIVYAGNSQGRDPIEADARGCMLVSVRDDGVPRVEHRAMPSQVRRPARATPPGVRSSRESRCADAGRSTSRCAARGTSRISGRRRRSGSASGGRSPGSNRSAMPLARSSTSPRSGAGATSSAGCSARSRERGPGFSMRLAGGRRLRSATSFASRSSRSSNGAAGAGSSATQQAIRRTSCGCSTRRRRSSSIA